MENKPKNFIAFDLELNKIGANCTKIIQIGAIAFTLEPFTILEELSVFVNPNELISPFITTLTGITQEMADSGVDLNTAYGKLAEMKIRHNCESSPVVWGGGDVECLKKQVLAAGNTNRFIFGFRYFDSKTLFQSYMLSQGLKTQSGLKKACNRMGLIFGGPAHNALKDSIGTAQMFRKMIELYKNAK